MVVVRFSETSAGSQNSHIVLAAGATLTGISGWLAAIAVVADITDVILSTLVFLLAFLSSFLTGFTAFSIPSPLFGGPNI